MGQFVPAEFAGRLVVDLCDVDSAKFESYADNHAWPRRWIYAREARLLAAEEARLAHRSDATLLISEDEAELFRRRIGRTRANVITLANGIDTALFDPATVAPHPRLADDPGPHIMMTGQMDYPPNVAAVLRTARQLMPAIREVYPAAKFHAVGRNAGDEVRALGGLNGTRVWGEVPDVRPFLAAADLVIAPLTIARGVQNKVLEAMAMARPILLSAEAATGIGAAHGEHYVVGTDDHDMVKRALALLGDGPAAFAMGVSARRFVIGHQSWDTALAPLAEIVGGPTAEARDAA
jgi:sugar transferase (PEP-CTERM/EpsH1 system associated)